MAEEFVIRVQVDNLQGRSAEPRTGQNASVNRGTGLGDQALANLSDARLGQAVKPYSSIVNPDGTLNDIDYLPYKSRFKKDDLAAGQSIIRDKYIDNFKQKMVRVVEEDGSTMIDAQQQTLLGATAEAFSPATAFLHQHRARIRASATIAINSGIRANLAVKAHRSGNSFANEQRQNAASASSQLASIGVAGAI